MESDEIDGGTGFYKAYDDLLAALGYKGELAGETYISDCVYMPDHVLDLIQAL